MPPVSVKLAAGTLLGLACVAFWGQERSLAELGVLTLPELRRRAEKRGHKMTSSNPGGGPMDDNELQLRLFAQSRCFVETQGGLMRVRACSS